MPKRKRDLCTVIESINTLFGSGEPTAYATEDHEGDTGNRGASSDFATTYGWLGEGAAQGSDQESRSEAVQLASIHTHVSTYPSREAEVAATTLTPEVATRWAAGPSGVPGLVSDQGEGDREGGQPAGYIHGTGNRGINEVTGPSLGTEAERELVISAFWRLLADAGHDVW